MKKNFGFSDAFNLALHSVIILAKDKDKKYSIKELAFSLTASSNHLSKVMQTLSKAGIVSSTNGPKGGFYLIRDAKELRIADIYEAIEGKMVFNNCLFYERVCERKNCAFGDLLVNINSNIKDKFNNTTISQIVE